MATKGCGRGLGAGKLDIDHVVPLAEAWDSDASEWSAQRRQAYANDLDSERSLETVTARSNRQKSDQDPATWWVPSEQALCQYLSDWVRVKTRWKLPIDEAEKKALVQQAAGCPKLKIDVQVAD